jgi:hypothetical protein
VNLPLELGPGAPTGGPTLLVRNVIFTDADGNSIPATLNYSPMDAWRQQNFSDSEITADGLVGDSDDADGDGQANLWEYGVGGNPRVPSADGTPEVAASPGPGARQLALLIRQQRATLPQLELVAETSDDLRTGWRADPAAVIQPTGQSDAQTVEMQASVEMDGTAKFLRLGFRRKP